MVNNFIVADSSTISTSSLTGRVSFSLVNSLSKEDCSSGYDFQEEGSSESQTAPSIIYFEKYILENTL